MTLHMLYYLGMMMILFAVCYLGIYVVLPGHDDDFVCCLLLFPAAPFCQIFLKKVKLKNCPTTAVGPIVAYRTYPNQAQRRLGRLIEPTSGPSSGVQRGAGE